MSSIGNNLKLDDEIEDIMESLLREYLAQQPEDGWFTRRSLYQELGIKLTLKREGTLDLIIEKTLSDWNWYRFDSSYWGISYIRRNRPTKSVSFTLRNGTVESTELSWPPFLPPAPKVRKGSSPDKVRRQLLGTKSSDKLDTLRLVATDGILPDRR